MTMLKKRAVELINCMSDENVLNVIKFLQKLNVSDVSQNKLKTDESDDGSLEYLFRDYVDDGIREPIIDFGISVGNEKW
ncbi:hypothetical protein FACS1894190_03910 [Spirochaetia bacterium]|nr:hypothetical protein FACS1894190_03910 [Spirochaetia bacterium]